MGLSTADIQFLPSITPSLATILRSVSPTGPRRRVCRLLAGEDSELGVGGEPSDAPRLAHRVRHALRSGKLIVFHFFLHIQYFLYDRSDPGLC